MKRRGFTLIEVLVASALLALTATLGYGALARVLDVRARLESQQQALAGAQGFFLIATRDLEAAVARPVRDALGSPEAAFRVDAQGWRLTRTGSPDLTDPPRSTLRRVHYRGGADGVHRAVWPVLDAVQASAPVDALVLPGGSELRVRCLDAGGQWQTAWPPGRVGNALPRAVELSVHAPRLGTLTRVLVLSP